MRFRNKIRAFMATARAVGKLEGRRSDERSRPSPADVLPQRCQSVTPPFLAQFLDGHRRDSEPRSGPVRYTCGRSPAVDADTDEPDIAGPAGAGRVDPVLRGAIDSRMEKVPPDLRVFRSLALVELCSMPTRSRDGTKSKPLSCAEKRARPFGTLVTHPPP